MTILPLAGPTHLLLPPSPFSHWFLLPVLPAMPSPGLPAAEELPAAKSTPEPPTHHNACARGGAHPRLPPVRARRGRARPQQRTHAGRSSPVASSRSPRPPLQHLVGAAAVSRNAAKTSAAETPNTHRQNYSPTVSLISIIQNGNRFYYPISQISGLEGCNFIFPVRPCS
jgi:hypothetical protein